MEPEHLEELLRTNYSLKDVKPTGERIGHGAYGYVEEVDVNGAVCAAKKVHRVLLHHNNEGLETFKQKFFGECVIMSKLRHPHVVQFLGVYFPSDDQRRTEEQFEASVGSTPPTPYQGLLLPWLIMELLPINLANFLETDKDVFLPYSVKSSLLLDISKGLTYLHGQTPTIIHRDLTAKNILINSALVAKIADFGVARITDPDMQRYVHWAGHHSLHAPRGPLQRNRRRAKPSPLFHERGHLFFWRHHPLYTGPGVPPEPPPPNVP